MSFTLHTTEIWFHTGTDSGGMKDRKHGIFLLFPEIKQTNCQKRKHLSSPSHSDFNSVPDFRVKQESAFLYVEKQFNESLEVSVLSTRRDGPPCNQVQSMRLWFIRNPPGAQADAVSTADLDQSLSLSYWLKSEAERDQACPAAWLQGFRLFLKSSALACCHRSEPNDCLVISDAIPPLLSSSPTSASLSARLRVPLTGKHDMLLPSYTFLISFPSFSMILRWFFSLKKSSLLLKLAADLEKKERLKYI